MQFNFGGRMSQGRNKQFAVIAIAFAVFVGPAGKRLEAG
jgi:hypothetical protein